MYDEEERQQIKDQLEMYSLLNVLWHLCEILFIETLPVGCLVQQLLEWVRERERGREGERENKEKRREAGGEGGGITKRYFRFVGMTDTLM